jgi:hypothetical protein
MDAIVLIFASLGIFMAYMIYSVVALRFRLRKETERKIKEA